MLAAQATLASGAVTVDPRIPYILLVPTPKMPDLVKDVAHDGDGRGDWGCRVSELTAKPNCLYAHSAELTSAPGHP